MSYTFNVNKSNKIRQASGHTQGGEGPEPSLPEIEAERLSALQLVDVISHKLLVQGTLPSDMSLLRRHVEEMEEMQEVRALYAALMERLASTGLKVSAEDR